MYPFFYLEAGGIKIFQPQNEFKGEETILNIMTDRNRLLRIRAIGEPAAGIDGANLWLNGRRIERNYQILKLKDSILVDELRKINQRGNNV